MKFNSCLKFTSQFTAEILKGYSVILLIMLDTRNTTTEETSACNGNLIHCTL